MYVAFLKKNAAAYLIDYSVNISFMRPGKPQILWTHFPEVAWNECLTSVQKAPVPLCPHGIPVGDLQEIYSLSFILLACHT